MESTGGADSFSTVFSGDLSHNLFARALENIDTPSTSSWRAASELIDRRNYNSLLSMMSSTDYTPQPPPYYNSLLSMMSSTDYTPQPPPFDSFITPTTSNQAQPIFSSMQPPYYPMQQHDAYVHEQTRHDAAYVPVGFVDHDHTSDGYENLLGVLRVHEQFRHDAYVPARFVDHDHTSNGYEYLLEVHELIRHVNASLSLETISNNLKTSRVPAVTNVNAEGEVCAVCQDEYKVNETVGSLECGHRYHADCIKEWLLHKNVCPICKATALVL